MTTDLSGFGQWVDSVLGHEGQLEDGVRVIHRDDSNYFEVCTQMAQTITSLLAMPAKNRTGVRRRAASLADQAQWKHFIKYYYDAYEFAFKRVEMGEE